ncbi:MAG: glycosyltransferase family 25 protein [Verrucomicrobiota bacterium]|nr:glycosyltransferase family 25 protein [Verrucomicrobiota bacterium]
MKPFFLLFLFLLTHIEAGIETYFQPAKDKTGNYRLGNIDCIYVINLDERPEKWERTLNSLKTYGISPYRFSAVNGWKLSFQAIDELGIIFEPWMPPGPIATVYRHVDGQEYIGYEIMKEIGTTYYCHSLSRGAIGCILSHLSILQDAYDSGYEIIWIMEDDIKVASNPQEIPFLISSLNHSAPDWDVLFTDNEIKGPEGKPIPCMVIRPRPLLELESLEFYRMRISLNADITKIGMRFGSASMVVKRSGMKKILDFFKIYKIYFPYDIDYFLVPGIQLYACNRDIVTNISGGDSDNGKPAYLEKK